MVAIGSTWDDGGKQDNYHRRTTVKDLASSLRAWVAAGLIDEDQAKAIQCHEAEPSDDRRVPLIAEVLGYLGGSLALIANLRFRLENRLRISCLFTLLESDSSKALVALCREKDLNLRRHCRQIYSLLPLAARASRHARSMLQAAGRLAPSAHSPNADRSTRCLCVLYFVGYQGTPPWLRSARRGTMGACKTTIPEDGREGSRFQPARLGHSGSDR